MRYTDLLINRDEKLREYQAKHKQEIYEAWDNNHRRVMLQMPTGTGKTYLFVSIIKDLQNYYQNIGEHCRVLVLAHRNEIIKQICNTLYNKYKVSCVAAKIDIPVIMLSSVVGKGTMQTMQCLTWGAADFITKPSGS
ncbi:MAG: DEAD/DEAH box helicase family protein, partial [Alistipes sp.]|nr:DEAD/DEAH box helicase family protein [Alistipes sp.]